VARAPEAPPPDTRGLAARLAALGAIGLLAALAALAVRWGVGVARATWEDLEPPRAEVPAWRRGELPGALDATLTTADGLALRGWYVRSQNGAAVALVHGLGGNRLQLLPVAAGLARRGYGVLVFDLRAHGESQGKRTGLGTAEQQDVAAAIDFLTARPEVDPRRIGALGFSIGGLALALEAAGDPRVAAVALAGMPASLADMVRTDEPGLRGELALLALRAAGIAVRSVRPADALCRLAPRPLLLVYGADDPATALGSALPARACGPVRLVVLPGVRHAGYATVGGERLEAEVATAFDAALAAPGRSGPRP